VTHARFAGSISHAPRRQRQVPFSTDSAFILTEVWEGRTLKPICPARRQSIRSLIQQMAPSRQERRKAERDAAKRAPAQAGAAGAAGAAAALANLNVNAGGDWTTQSEDPRVGPGGYKLADIALLPLHTMSNNSRDDTPCPKRRHALPQETTRLAPSPGRALHSFTLACGVGQHGGLQFH
jgi:hypothetical protein